MPEVRLGATPARQQVLFSPRIGCEFQLRPAQARSSKALPVRARRCGGRHDEPDPAPSKPGTAAWVVRPGRGRFIHGSGVTARLPCFRLGMLNPPCAAATACPTFEHEAMSSKSRGSSQLHSGVCRQQSRPASTRSAGSRRCMRPVAATGKGDSKWLRDELFASLGRLVRSGSSDAAMKRRKPR